MLRTSRNLRRFTYAARDNYFVSAGGITLLRRWYANKQNWHRSQNSYWEGVHHYLVILLDLTQLSLHIEPCGCRRTFPQEGIRAPAGRDCQIVPGKHWPLRFRMILECHLALTGIPPFVVAMEEGRYSLWRLCIDDDDDEYDDDDEIWMKAEYFACIMLYLLCSCHRRRWLIQKLLSTTWNESWKLQSESCGIWCV